MTSGLSLRFLRMPDTRLTDALFQVFNEDVPGVIEEISTDPTEDPFGQDHPEAYLASGQWAMRRIKLAMLAANKRSFSRILDLPSGYGRVLRVLKAAFPEAEITACDIHRPAVDFCERVFGAIPVYSTERPEDIPLEGPFDLIWVGSLLTHVDEPQWDSFLDLFERLTEPGGLLVFTALGRFVAEEQMNESNYGVPESQEALIRSFKERGFGYASYAAGIGEPKSLPRDYGIALASPGWVASKLDHRKFDLLTYTAGGWGGRWGEHREPLGTAAQDFIGCIRMSH